MVLVILRPMKIGMLCAAALAGAILPASVVDAAEMEPDKDPQFEKMLQEAHDLINAKQLRPAIEKCDRVLAAFQERYGKAKEKIYCARGSAENLGYLLKATSEADKGKSGGKKVAMVISPTWASAWFIKGYALEEMGKIADAKSALKHALELSPWNSHYLSELAYLTAMEKNLPEAKKLYEAAEEHAELSPDDSKAEERGRARRGIGYVLVEMGKLDEAEKKYQECLRDDPNDKKAAAELEYVRNLKAKMRAR
jgi:tetratricopeptide (TPR) repeat protein